MQIIGYNLVNPDNLKPTIEVPNNKLVDRYYDKNVTDNLVHTYFIIFIYSFGMFFAGVIINLFNPKLKKTKIQPK